MGTIAVILIAAFAIDRLITGFFFLLSFSDDLRPLVAGDPGHADERAARTRRLLYALVAGYLGTVVIAGILKVRLFEMSQIAGPGDPKPNALLDTLLTGMILAGGADRLAEILKFFGGGAAGERKADRPIEITGKLVLEQGREAAASKSHSA